MSGTGGVHDPLPLGEDLGRSAIVNIVRRQHADAAVAMLGVVPREERAAMARGVLDAREATRKAGLVFQGLELRLRERIVIADLGSAERSRHTEIREQLGCAFARHGRSPIGVKR